MRDFIVRYKYLLKLIVTVLITASVPLLIVIWFMVGNVYGSIQDQDNEKHLINATYFMSLFTEQRTKMFETAVLIGYEKKILPENIDMQAYNMIEAVKQLNVYCLRVSTAEDCFVGFKNTDYLIGSKNKYLKEYFLNKYAGDSSEMANRINNLTEITTAEGTTIISSFDLVPYQEAVMLIGVPISVRHNSDAVVIYSFHYNSFATSFLGKAYADTYGMSIYDHTGKLVFTNSDGLASSDGLAAVSGFVANTKSDILETEMGGKTLMLYKHYSESLKLTFILEAPLEELEQPVQVFYRMFRLIVISVAVLFFLLLLATLYINYHPLSQITQRIRIAHGKDSVLEGELKTIDTALHQKENETKDLMNLVDKQTTIIINHILTNLIEGNTVSEVELSQLDMPLSGFFYCALAVLMPAMDDARWQGIRYNLLDQYGIHSCSVRSLEDNYLIIICSLPDKSRQDREKAAEAVWNEVYDTSAERCGKIVVGEAQNNLGKIRNSYLDAISAAEQASSGGIFYFEDVVDTFSNFEKYPSEMVLRFLYHVRQGDCEAALNELDKIVANITDNVNSQPIIRYMCYDIINVLISTLNHTGTPLSEQESGRLLRFTNLDDLHKGMISVIQPACIGINKEKQHANQRLTERVIEFIQENFNNPDLGLVMVADHFDISIRTLSRNFKETTEMGFKEYVINFRIAKSKQLLLTTDKPIVEIASDVGYRDVSHFVKMFRGFCGITPMHFRQEKREIRR